MWDEILASGDYLNQLAPSWQQEQDLHPEWKKILSSSSQDLKPAEPLVCRKETDHDLRLAIDLYRRFGYELVDLKCLFEDPWYKKRSERFWKRWKERLPEALAQDSRLAKIKANYTGALAIEPPQDPQKAAFLWQLVEEFRLDPACYQELVWKCLSRATHFEQFLHKHFVGQKRFSLEGCETLIAVLEVLFREFAKQRGKHVALGMSHRGRLNVLAHCLGKPYTHILKEFDTSFDFLIEDMGDVKYHKGHASWREFDEGKLFVEMLANPSHLESVDPVLLGFCKEQQRQKSFDEVLPLLLHGDAALSGQGVVYETLQISGVHGYGPVGILHLVVNNQVGFTAIPVESRQGDFCTDIARSFDIPVFHVSVQKPMECVRAVLMALAYRRQFKSDVFVDFIGYRKWGHNEADEPRYTNPDLYEKIDKAPLVLDLFAQDIGLEPELKKEHEGQVLNDLKDSYEKTQQQKPTQSATKEQLLHHRSEGLAEHFLEQLRLVETGTPAQDLRQWAEAIFHLPDALGVHPKIRVLYNSRLEKVRQGVGLDWACAEMLAYGSLLSGGHGVRLSGQDIVRGTFSHRQVGVKAQGEKDYIFSMNRLSQATKRFEAYNSPLSEFAVLGFEYGYSLAASEDLVIWEAQFGDFANGAQVMIDQFISSAQSKWGINSRLTLFLPHGFEGQGPEHSSARIERFLALSARGNWCVAQVSTPHQLFHLIRRQMLQPIRRPLVLFTPKALLRHPECISSIEAFTHHRFNEIILDAAHGGTRAVLCSGKLYYDIASLVKESGAALLRLEQLYPLALDTIFEILGSMQELKEVIWIQEEPINMGPSVWIRQNLQGPLLAKGLKWTMLGRDRTNCIATGYPLRHKLELEVLMYQLREALKN